MEQFKIYNRQDVLSLTRIRRFETKLGERIGLVKEDESWTDYLEKAPGRFVLFGIPEDIGIRANYGTGGSDSGWIPFLSAFLNLQSNDFMDGEELLLLGHFDFGDLRYLIEKNAMGYEEKTEAYRHAVTIIDEAVEDMAKRISAAGKIPIAIGGGHNNAYPLIKGVAKGLHKAGKIPLAQINCINLDAHTDYRPLEGRHSGNGFRYAEEDGYLGKYFMLGAQENYIPQNVWLDIVNNPFLDLISFENIFLEEKCNFVQAVTQATSFTDDNFTGIELDLDIVERALSSAQSPVGISSLQARQYIHLAARFGKPAYLHICEAASQLEDGRKDELTGKMISYLISDFVKAMPA